MKTVISLLVLCLLLGGCAAAPDPTEPPQKATDPTVLQTEPAPTQAPASPMLQTAITSESAKKDFETVYHWGDYGYEQNLVWCELPIQDLLLIAIDSEDAENWTTDGSFLYSVDALNPGEAVNLDIMIPEGFATHALTYTCQGVTYTYGIGYNGRDGGISFFEVDPVVRIELEETAPPTESLDAFPAVIYTVIDKDGGAKLVREEKMAQSKSAWHVWLLLKENTTLIPGGAYLNDFTIDGTTGYLDLAEGIYAANVGSEYELFLIISIANTFIDTYDLSELYLTVNGDIYSGGHVEFDEPFTLEYP